MLSLVVYLALFGFLVWLLVTYVPMVEPFKNVIVVICVIIAIIWVLNALGLTGGLNSMPNLGPAHR